MPVRPKQLSDPNPEHRQNYTAEYYLYDLFFYELSEGLRSPMAAQATHPKSSEFIDRAINLIVDCARNIASGESQLSFSTLYYAANAIEPIEGRNFNDPSYSQYFGFKDAMRRISVDTHLIKQPSGRCSPLSDSELASARASKHWSKNYGLTSS